DDLWVRIVDVPGALEARRYRIEGRLVLEVDDPRRPGAGGRFELEGGPDGARCVRTDAEPEVVLDVGVLGSLYLGGVRAGTPARAHRRTGRRRRDPGRRAVQRRPAAPQPDPLLTPPRTARRGCEAKAELTPPRPAASGAP